MPQLLGLERANLEEQAVANMHVSELKKEKNCRLVE
jgi:hypothetical protein